MTITPRFISTNMFTAFGDVSWDGGIDNAIQDWELDVIAIDDGDSYDFFATNSEGVKVGISHSSYQRAVRQCHHGIVRGRMSFDGDEIYFTDRDIDDEPSGEVGEIYRNALCRPVVNVGEMTVMDFRTGASSTTIVYAGDCGYDTVSVTRYTRKSDEVSIDVQSILEKKIFINEVGVAVRGEIASWRIFRNGQPFSGYMVFPDLERDSSSMYLMNEGEFVSEMDRGNAQCRRMELELVCYMKTGEVLRGMIPGSRVVATGEYTLS